MCPRPYRADGRKQAAEKTRARIVTAARELIAAQKGVTEFTIDAVATQAGVARMTVYYQFGSKRGLLEAIFDDIAARGGICRVGEAFRQMKPLDALAEFVAVFGRFWTSERLIIGRLRALAILDSDFEEALRGRDERRREGVRFIVQRLAERFDKQFKKLPIEPVELLLTLTSFETFDSLAGNRRTPEDVVPVIMHLAKSALGLCDK